MKRYRQSSLFDEEPSKSRTPNGADDQRPADIRATPEVAEEGTGQASQLETEPDVAASPAAHSEPEPEPQVAPEPAPEPAAELEPEPEPEPHAPTEPQAAPEPEPDGEPEPVTVLEAESEVEPEPQPEPQPEEPSEPQPESRPEPIPDTEPQGASNPVAADNSVDTLADSAFFSEPSVIPDVGQAAVDAFFGPPRLDRPRPTRPPLIPRRVWIVAGVLVAVALFAAGAVAISGTFANISVPALGGTSVGAAETRLAIDGLQIAVSERRFSPKAADTVLEQTPAPGTRLRRGDTVSVVVSAGSEQFALPNVVKDGVLLAQGILSAKGIDVRIDAEPSQLPSDTVLASNPPAGTMVHSGQIVRLSVAAPGPNHALLLPYDMTGVKVVIDPAPVNDQLTDVPLDVARRLRSLIEASKGVVISTRALAETSTLDSVPNRANRASSAPSTVAIGLSAASVGSGGLIVFAPSPVLQYASASAKLASRVGSDLASEAGAVQSATSTTDTVLSAANSPWTRIQLGSFAQREDVSKFSDSAWEDSVARGLYRALAELYGKRQKTTP